MADSYVQGSFAFTCSNAEMALIEEAFQASYDLGADIELSASSPEFLEAFPPVMPHGPRSGFLAIFPDPDFPNLGVEFEGGNSLERPEISTVMFYSMTDFPARRACRAHPALLSSDIAAGAHRVRMGLQLLEAADRRIRRRMVPHLSRSCRLRKYKRSDQELAECARSGNRTSCCAPWPLGRAPGVPAHRLETGSPERRHPARLLELGRCSHCERRR